MLWLCNNVHSPESADCGGGYLQQDVKSFNPPSWKILYFTQSSGLYCDRITDYGIGNLFVLFYKKCRKMFIPDNKCVWCRKALSGQSSTVLACMIPQSVSDAESVDVATSGHVTKMAVTLFDPSWPKNSCYTQTSWLHVLSYCGITF